MWAGAYEGGTLFVDAYVCGAHEDPSCHGGKRGNRGKQGYRAGGGIGTHGNPWGSKQPRRRVRQTGPVGGEATGN